MGVECERHGWIPYVAACPECGESIASDCSLRRFNPRRALRGAPAAELEIDGELLWMDRDDIRKNRILLGDLPGLVKAADHYDSMIEYRGVPD